MKKIILTTIICLFTAISTTVTAQTFSGGSGTEQSPYLISSKADMAALAMSVNDGNKYSGKYFLLTQDLTGISTRIGNSSSNCFSGIFDGGGFKVTVSIDVAAASGEVYGGVFGYISSATIKNLGIAGSVSSSSSSSNYSYAGGICGYATNSTISNCYSTGNISSSTSSYYSYAGGICGYANKITNCFAANSSVESKKGSSNGSAGRISGSSATIEICYALSSMQVNGSTVSSQSLTSTHGKDANLSSLQSQAWIEDNLFWDFTDTWYVPNGSFPLLKKQTKLTFNLPETIVYGDNISLNATPSGNLNPVVFSSSDNSIAEVNGNVLKIKKAGTVTVTASQQAAEQYSSATASRTIIIGKRPLTVTANDATIVYGNTPQYSCIYEGFANNDTEANLATKPKFTCSGTSASSVGTYTITPSGAVSDNYNFTYQTGTLTIVKRTLKVTPNNTSRMYGDDDYYYFSFTYEGFVNGNSANNLSSRPIATTTATTTSPVGNYEITCSGGLATNYDFDYGTGTLTITKAPLFISAYNQYRYYGEANPVFEVSYSGFRNSDTQAVLSSQPQISCAASPYSGAGTYPISISGNITAHNYEVTLSNGVLTIYKAHLIAQADNKTRKQNEANPEFTITYSGFVNNENEFVLDELPNVNCNANVNSPAGKYPIVVSGGYDNNYNITGYNGMLEVVASTGIGNVNVSEISVYPNPVKDELFIRSEQPVETVRILDISGCTIEILHTKPVLNGEITINISHLPKGVYFVKIGNVRKKIIKQ